jgi:hypothetical protein
LLIRVGSGRVLRGGSFSATGFPVTSGGGGGKIKIVVTVGCVGRAILLEKTWVLLEVVEEGEAGETGDAEELGRVDVATVVNTSVI